MRDKISHFFIMDEKTIRKALAEILIGGLRYFDSIGSTNDVALAWAVESALDFSLVTANEQTSGRGRSDRKWYTPHGTALAFSLIFRLPDTEREAPLLFTGLGALALVNTLSGKFNLNACIKWPNDVLIDNRKVAGVLLETVWMGDVTESIVLGMGINVLSASVPPADKVDFPATSIEDEIGYPVDRVELLKAILTELAAWRTRTGSPEFVAAWESQLAYRGEQVQITDPRFQIPQQQGQLLGLYPDGSLRLKTKNGETLQVHFGDVHLRPAGV